jgi:transporter family protein
MNWVPFAILSALTAALVAIFGKLGLRAIDSTLATTIRSVIMAIFLITTSLFLGKFSGFNFTSLAGRDWLLIIAAGIAGALSWIFYFFALKIGPVNGVVSFDRLSLVFVVIMAALFVGEALTWRVGLGAALMIGGALLISLK